MEVWKDISGTNGQYQISDKGNLRSLYREGLIGKGKRGIIYRTKLLSTNNKNNAGYHIVTLQGRIHTIHRLVAEAFIPNPLGLKDVNHIDEDKDNNKATNLEWMSHKDNMNYGSIKARLSKSSSKPFIKKTIKHYHNEIFINETNESLGTPYEASLLLNKTRARLSQIIHKHSTINYNGNTYTLRLERIEDVEVKYIPKI